MRMEEKLLRAWNDAERLLLGLIGIAALVLATYQAGARYLSPWHQFVWADEVVVYLLAWAAFIGASQLIFLDSHVRADVFVRHAPERWQRRIEIFNCAIALILCITLAYYGAIATGEAWRFDERSNTGAQFPLWIYYAGLPLSGILMTLRFMHRLYLQMAHPQRLKQAMGTGRES